MTQPSLRRPTSRLVAALLALVAMGIVASSKAEAGCSHYALTKAQRDADAALENLDILPVDLHADASLPGVPERRKPCSGPTCSEGPSAPGVPAPPAPSSGERELCAWLSEQLAPLGGSRFVSPESTPRARVIPTTLDRPPRSHSG